MIRNRVCYAVAVTVAAFLVLAPQVNAQSKASTDSGWGDSLVKWDTTCSAKGCLMQTDVLRGVSDDPPDPNDFREYIGLEVALYRKMQRPGYFAFLIDPRAQRDQGIFIIFSKTVRENGQWKLKLDPEGPSRLTITDCNDEACAARVPLGLVEAGPDRNKMDLLDKFLSSNHLLVLYMKGGRAYRTMVILSSFQKEYKRVMESEMAQPPPNK